VKIRSPQGPFLSVLISGRGCAGCCAWAVWLVGAFWVPRLSVARTPVKEGICCGGVAWTDPCHCLS
jgi:hypothetical protein